MENFLINTITSKLNILILESDSYFRINFNDYLNEIFNSVTYCNDEKSFVELFNKTKADIVFVDLQTESIDIFAMIKSLDKILLKTVLIAVSDNKDSHQLIKVIKHRFYDILFKKFSAEVLKTSIVESLSWILIANSNELLKQDIENIKSLNVNEMVNSLIEKDYKKVELINHFKGIPVMKEAFIIDFKNNTLNIKTKQIQLNAMADSGHTVVTSKYLSKNIFAKVGKFDQKNSLVQLTDLKFIDSHSEHRKNVRIVPDKSFNLLYEDDGKKHKCNVVDISPEHILVSFENLPLKFKISTKIFFYLSFRSPIGKVNDNNFSIHYFKRYFIIENIFKVKDKIKVLIKLDLEEFESNKFNDYIYYRSLMIIKEYKKAKIN